MPANLGFPLPFNGAQNVPQILAQSAVAASVTGTLTETTLATIPIPAGAMGVNGSVRITAKWSLTNNANAKSLYCRLAGSIAGINAGAASLAAVVSLTTIHNRGVLNSQVGTAPGLSGIGGAASAQPMLAIDMSQAQNITLSCALGNTGDTATLEAYIVELLNP